MAHLCHEYWINTYEMESVTAFANYFISTWVNSDLCNWFETASDFASTNNGLECLNRVIKDTRTLRKKMPLNEFTANVEQMLTDWSNKPEYQVINALEPGSACLLRWKTVFRFLNLSLSPPIPYPALSYTALISWIHLISQFLEPQTLKINFGWTFDFSTNFRKNFVLFF